MFCGCLGQIEELQAYELAGFAADLHVDILDLFHVVEGQLKRVVGIDRGVRFDHVDADSAVAQIENLGQMLFTADAQDDDVLVGTDRDDT